MRKIVGTFVDHQEAVQYPVGLISEPYVDFDAIYWFVGDEENLGILEDIKASHSLRDKIVVVNIGQKINTPRDIGTAQTDSVAFMQTVDKADIVGYQQADLCLTQLGMDAVNQQLKSATPTTAFGITAMQNKLYCESYPTPHCCFFIGSEIEHNWPGGWENKWRVPNGVWQFFPPISYEWGTRLMIDLGYFDTGAYYRKMVNHQNIWGPHHRLVEMQGLFETDKRAALLRGWEHLAIEVSKTEGYVPLVVEYETPYKEVIDKLDIYEDYCFCKAVQEEHYAGNI